MKFFLPALLFFVLGTGTSAMPPPPHPPQNSVITLKIPITYNGINNARAQGYWRSEREVVWGPVVVYIGPKGDSLKLYHGNSDYLPAYKGTRAFLRIKTPEEFFGLTNEKHPSSEGPFPKQEIEDHEDDRVTVEIEPPGESKNIADARLAIVRLIEPLAHPHNSLALPLTDVGPRGFGHWRLKETNGVVAYINSTQLQLDYSTTDDLNSRCNGVPIFVRILTRAECTAIGGEDIECQKFSQVDKKYEDNQVTIHANMVGFTATVTLLGQP